MRAADGALLWGHRVTKLRKKVCVLLEGGVFLNGVIYDSWFRAVVIGGSWGCQYSRGEGARGALGGRESSTS